MHALLRSADFFQNQLFLKKIFQEYHQMVKQFGSISGPLCFGTDLCSNCLQTLPADDTSRLRVNYCLLTLSKPIQLVQINTLQWLIFYLIII